MKKPLVSVKVMFLSQPVGEFINTGGWTGDYNFIYVIYTRRPRMNCISK